MRRLHSLIALLALVATPVFAQAPATPAPPPAVPDAQPPGLIPIDSSIEPQVTIRRRDGEMVEEHRVNGKLYKITVHPENGAPYTLIDQRGDGSFVPFDAPGSPQLSVPMWVIHSF